MKPKCKGCGAMSFGADFCPDCVSKSLTNKVEPSMLYSSMFTWLGYLFVRKSWKK